MQRELHTSHEEDFCHVRFVWLVVMYCLVRSRRLSRTSGQRAISTLGGSLWLHTGEFVRASKWNRIEHFQKIERLTIERHCRQCNGRRRKKGEPYRKRWFARWRRWWWWRRLLLGGNVKEMRVARLKEKGQLRECYTRMGALTAIGRSLLGYKHAFPCNKCVAALDRT